MLRFLRVSRANFLPVSILPYTLGSVYAAAGARLHCGRYCAGLAGVAAVHLAANLLNEYWDHRLGADGHGAGYRPHSGGSQAIQGGLLSAERVRTAGWCLLLFALSLAAAGAVMLQRPMILAMVAAGAALAWAYTARPASLAYRGLGEAAIFIAFGPLLVLGGYYLQAGEFSGPALLLSLSPGFLITAMLVANEMADADADRAARKYNLAVRLGRRACLMLVGACVALCCIIPLAGICGRAFPQSFLLVLVLLPAMVRAVAALRRAVMTGSGFESSSGAMVRLCMAYPLVLILVVILL